MHIALCDDNLQDRSVLAALLDQYRRKTGTSIFVQSYADGITLLEDMRLKKFDLLLLDVMMPLANGIEIAREVRGFDENVEIAFLTCSTEFAVEGYEVNALSYLLKPVAPDKLFAVLDKMRRRAEQHAQGLSVKLKGGVASILYDRIAYVEVLNRKVRFHMTDKSIKELAGSLADYEERLLSQPQFTRTHRAFIVNLDQIQELDKLNALTFSGECVPVSRRLAREVKASYMERLFLQDKAD